VLNEKPLKRIKIELMLNKKEKMTWNVEERKSGCQRFLPL